MILYNKVVKHKCREIFLELRRRDSLITFERGRSIILKLLAIFLQPSDLCALIWFRCYWFHLDLAMNNTTEEFLQRFPECILLFSTKDKNERILLTAIYVSLIPLIIGANLLLIIGIIKTKRSKFTSSQILFSALFVNDLAFGVVQLPSKIYLLWKSSAPTCFEVQLSIFSLSFPLGMSFNLLCVISIERYFNVVHNIFYTRIVTKKLLAFTIACLALISSIWSITDAQFRTRFEIVKLAKVYIALSAYSGTVLVIAIVLNVSLLRNVKRKTQNSSVQQTLDSSLTKTIGLIIGMMVAAYLPAIVAIYIAAYTYINSADRFYIKKRGSVLLWALMPSQINAVLNSVVYLTRNSRMRRYYSKLFNRRNEENKMERVQLPTTNVTTDISNSS